MTTPSAFIGCDGNMGVRPSSATSFSSSVGAIGSDPIDAPLDDANIGRFIDMLQGMQDHTQFIIITHSRKTMEIADRLYGVTMEEPGVSKLLSLELN